MLHRYDRLIMTDEFSRKIKRQHRTGNVLIIINFIAWIAIIVMLLGCKPPLDPTRQFLIKKGDHYAFLKLSQSLQNQRLVFHAWFNETANYDFQMNSYAQIFQPVAMKRGNTCSTGAYFKLWPHFGGHVAAPHDAVIDIKSFY